MAPPKARARQRPSRSHPASAKKPRPARSRPKRGDEAAGPCSPPVPALLERLHAAYPQATCELRWENPLQLLVATILSAQSTDKKVNEVTPGLFARYRTAEDYAAAPAEEFEQEVRQTGFYRNKTKAILGTAQRLVAHFGGRVPDTMAELLTLPGVARKTANVVLGTAFQKAEGVVVDTHVQRLAQRIGFSRQQAPEKIERDLMDLLPREEWIFVGHALTWHGRRVCAARKPRCSECTLYDLCLRRGV